MNTISKIRYTHARPVCSWLCILSVFFAVSSCKKYLDVKSDKSFEIPSTLQDCQALLDNTNYMNNGKPYQGELGTDNLVMSDSQWASNEKFDRDDFIWKSDAGMTEGPWFVTYQAILSANQVLATLDKIPQTAGNQQQWNAMKGAALFYRGYSLFTAAQIFTKPYNAATAASDLGMPIRLTPDISEKTVRANLKQTYDQIIQDLQGAVNLMPATAPLTAVTKTRPCKAGAYAALARCYLAMSDYTNAGLNANAALQLYSTLINYNDLDITGDTPIKQFNAEVIFDDQSNFSLPFYYGYVNPLLYGLYESNDMRKTVFFGDKGDGTFRFKDGYNGTPNYILFTGLATDELLLIRAECSARASKTSDAMADVNTLLQNRYIAPYTPLAAAAADDALTIILKERRKELAFRGIYWTDLRRLNQDPRFAVTLTRSLNGTTYTLPPNDLRYTWLIPQAVLQRVNIPQNPR